jgi:polyhydroxybutyrate depolymerase
MLHKFCVLGVFALLLGCSEGSPSADSAQASLGCGQGSLEVGTTQVELEVDGRARSYEVYVPPSYDGETPLPLVLNFHGITGDGSSQAESTQMNADADERELVVVYPNGYEKSWNGGLCCGEAFADEVDDVAYTRAVVESVGERACVDTRRVYMTGFSNGGIMVHTLACAASDLFAAAAPVSGPRLVEPGACDDARPMPILMIQGIDDRLSSYELGEQGFGEWEQEYGCDGEPLVDDTLPSALCESYQDCTEGGAVTFCSISDHDHCWPGPLPCFWDETPTDFPGNEVILDFFEAVVLPAN